MDNIEIRNLFIRDEVSIWHPFTQHGLGLPLLPIARGKGSRLYDFEGEGYLDMISSWWVNLHGHGCPELAAAIASQVCQIDHVHFSGTTHEPAVQLAERILKKANLFGKAKVFYVDNGSTAVEVALKISHQYWLNQGDSRMLFATLRGAYHGDTIGAMSVGKSSKFFNAFTGLLFETMEFPVPLIWDGWENKEGIDEALCASEAILEQHGEKIAALIVEPLIQGAGGMRFHPAEFLNKFCTLFQERGIPIIFDEIMTGFGRTGSFFAFQKTSIIPDLICLSKGITGGILPLGVTISSNRIFDCFLGSDFSTALAHGHSYTANPVACAAALCSLDLHERNDSLHQVARINTRMKQHLQRIAEDPKIEKPRQLGGIMAFDLANQSGNYFGVAGRKFASKLQERGVIIRPLGNVIYLMPPYCITDEEIDEAFQEIVNCLKS